MIECLFSVKKLAPPTSDEFAFTPITNATDLKKQVSLKINENQQFSICLKEFLFLVICFLLSFCSLHEGYEKINANILTTDEWLDNNHFRHLMDSKIIYGVLVSAYHMSKSIASCLINIFIYYTYQEIGKQRLLHFLISMGLVFNFIGAGMCVGSSFWAVYLIGKILQGFSSGMNSVLIPFLIKFYIVDESTLYLAGIGTNLCSMNTKNGTMTGYIILYCCKKWYKGTQKVWVYPNISPFVFTALVAIGLAIFNFYYLPYLFQTADPAQEDESIKQTPKENFENTDFNAVFIGKKQTVLLGLVVLTFYSFNSVNYFLYYNNTEFAAFEDKDYDFSGLIYATVYTIGGNLSALVPYGDLLNSTDKSQFRVYKIILRWTSFLTALAFVIVVAVGYSKNHHTNNSDNSLLKTVFSFGTFIVFAQVFLLEVPMNYILIHFKILNSIDLFQLITYAAIVSDVVILLVTPVLTNAIGFLMCIIFGTSAMLLALTPM